jgi:hypothetical protein
MGVLQAEQKDSSLFAVALWSKEQEIIGYSIEMTPEQLALVDSLEHVDTYHDRLFMDFVDMLSGETVEQWIYTRNEDIYEVSSKAVYNRMDYLFECYLTRRFYF